MTVDIFKTERRAFEAASFAVGILSLDGRTNTGFRVLKRDNGYVVLMIPDARIYPGETPYYLGVNE